MEKDLLMIFASFFAQTIRTRQERVGGAWSLALLPDPTHDPGTVQKQPRDQHQVRRPHPSGVPHRLFLLL